MGTNTNWDSESISQGREGEAVIGTDTVAVWQRVFTAEHKLKKPRPPLTLH